MMFKAALALLCITCTLATSERINCDLVNEHERTQICNIYDISSTNNNRDTLRQAKSFKYIKSTSSSTFNSLEQIDQDIVPFSIDVKTGNLNWLNKHQPKWTRWSKLCPSSSQEVLHFCSNQLTCDLTGVCEIKFQIDDDNDNNLNNFLVVNLRDNLDKDADMPKFTNDLTFINVTFDLDEVAINEQVLIESTIKLDSERSKINRILNEFQLNMVLPWINPQHYKFYCGSSMTQKLGKYFTKLRGFISIE